MAADLFTPVAPCKFPWLNKPDTRWNKDGKYRVSLVFAPDDPFVQQIEAEAKAAFAEQEAIYNETRAAAAPRKRAQMDDLKYHDPIRDEEDAEGEVTGNVMIDFGTNATFKDRKTGTIKQITLKAADSFGRRIKNIPNVGSGSELVIAYKPQSNVSKGTAYYTLYLNAFQIVKLVEFGGGTGFKAQDGGWDGSDMDTEDTGTSEADGSEF